MSRGYQIILLGNRGSKSIHELQIILDFLGEISLVVDETFSVNDLPASESILAVIVEEGMDEAVQHRFQEHFSSHDKHLGFISLENAPPSGDFTLRTPFIGSLCFPLSYSKIQDALHGWQIRRETFQVLNATTEERIMPLFRSLVGRSKMIQEVRNLITQVAQSEASVLILGESGTGKEVVARNVHFQSNRKDKPFIPVNCGAIPSELLESELFGHEKGAFTGAISARKGRFEMAEGGTLFLDEIGDMPLPMQVKLLRVLQERCFERVGSNQSLRADVRIVSATHCDLEAAIAKGEFREDLYYRLNVFPIEMPPLRERITDLDCLLNELVARIESEGRPGVRFLPDAMKALQAYHWPGNIRELANLVERMAILSPGGMVGLKTLPKKFHGEEGAPEGLDRALHDTPSPKVSLSHGVESLPIAQGEVLPREGIDLKQHLMETEVQYIQNALDESNGVVAKAAVSLNMGRTTLVEKMRKYGISK